MSFEPYVDFDALTPEMARAVQESVQDYRRKMNALCQCESDDDVVHFAKEVLVASERAAGIVREISDLLRVTPVMVHIAGGRREETNPDDDEEHAVVQRCARCGSILHFWSEHMSITERTGSRAVEIEEIPWWNAGTVVAKTANRTGSNPVGMYPVEPLNRPLEAHEHLCADLTSLEEQA